MSILEKIFGTKNAPEKNDGLTQQEREALLDLLLYCKYVDNHLSLAEESVIQGEIDQFNWESGIDVKIYMSTATERVRKARTNATLENFLKDVSERLESTYSKETAQKLMVKLFQSDGEIDDAEKTFAEKMSAYLG
ncbi:MAG: hypothetical protein ACL93V_01985 [Candidatus Electrothrix sp. YB6]